MRDASTVQATESTGWRELFRCNDLRLARTVATCIAAMEFDVRLCSIHPAAANVEDEHDDVPGPHVIEVHSDAWRQLIEVLGEIIAEQREFDQSLEWRRNRNRARVIVVLSIGAAAEIAMIWRLLES